MTGWLSSIQIAADTEPEAVAWAHDEVLAQTKTHDAIHRGLNERLAGTSVPPVSRSAFYRWALRVRAGEIRRPMLALAPISSNDLADIAKQLRTLADRIEKCGGTT
ncbi:MAG: hypothetical protein H6895_15220 [Defluviimonas sp.]|nr:hypothetical protein [Rhodobiaceae bacterium]MCC0065411.1 hypothetical protein [Defluviimonas sp.]